MKYGTRTTLLMVIEVVFVTVFNDASVRLIT